MTSQITDMIARDGAYAVLVLMALDAVLPLGGELTMLYAGVLAAGALGAHVTVFGAHLPFGIESYALLVLAGTAGSLAGGLAGYAAGAIGGRALVERAARRLRVGADDLRRAEMWLERHAGRAVFVGRLTPLARSFISLPAGVLRCRLGVFTVASLFAALVWCAAFAGAGWAMAATWQSVDHGFRYGEYALLAAAAIALGVAAVRRRRPRPRPEQP